MADVSITDRTPFAYQRMGVTTAVIRRLSTEYRNLATAVFITVEDNNIRYRIDGGDPTATEGHLVISANYQNLYFADKASIRDIRMIGVGGTSTVTVTYYI